MKKLAIITTHPIQYNSPLFSLISKRGIIYVKVFYTRGKSNNNFYDARFDMQIRWDIPLLDGYDFEFAKNISCISDSNQFFGIITPGLINKLRSENFDAILIYRWSIWSHLCILQSFGSKVKLFFRGDSIWKKNYSPFTDYLKSKIFKFIYRRINKAFFVGKLNQEYYLKSNITNEKLIYAPHAIDNSRFIQNTHEFEQKASEERDRLGIPQSAIVFLYAGKYYGAKNLELLISAFKNLPCSNYRLLLYGGGRDEKRLKKISQQDNRIIFQSFKNQSDMPWVYRVGDVFVLPSINETWGLSVNEAMACRRPAIVSDACGCAPDLIVDYITGFVFHSGDELDLISKLSSFKTRENALSIGNGAFNHIQQFSLERIAELIEKEVMS